MSKIPEKAVEAVVDVIETPIGDQLLMLAGVVFVGCLVAHFVFGVGKDRLKGLDDGT